jgi:hypothetical protein
MADGARENQHVGFISCNDGYAKGMSRKINAEDGEMMSEAHKMFPAIHYFDPS